MKRYSKENILQLISICIAIVALGVSINVAIDNKKSKEIINKPELVIRPVKFEDTDTYLKCSRNGRTVSFEYNLQIKNKGNIAAKNITFPEKPYLPEFEKEKVIYNEHRSITIEQWETVFAVSGFEIQFASRNKAMKIMQLIDDPSWPGITFSIEVKYKSDLEADVQYIKKVGFQISKEDALLLINE
ncbi:hypothetical protein JW879_08305 [candidate division WOR-3 bacterium]|nr:hypothetical protein [candidate division WOR-3 bacterium]